MIKLQHRLLLSHAVTILLIATIGGYGYQTIKELEQSYRQLSSETLPLIAHLQELRLDAQTIADAGVSGAKLEQSEQSLQYHVESYQQLVARYFPDEAEFSSAIGVQAKQLLKLSQASTIARIRRTPESELAPLRAEIAAVSWRLRQIGKDAMAYEKEEVRERGERIDAHIQTHLNILGYGLLTLLLATLYFAWRGHRELTTPDLPLNSRPTTANTNP